MVSVILGRILPTLGMLESRSHTDKCGSGVSQCRICRSFNYQIVNMYRVYCGMDYIISPGPI